MYTKLHMAWYPDESTCRNSLHVTVAVPTCPMFDFAEANKAVPEVKTLTEFGFHPSGHTDGNTDDAPIGQITRIQTVVLTLDEVGAMQAEKIIASRQATS